MANDTLIVKRSPFVLIRTLVGIEFLAFVCYYLVTGRGSYKSELYNQLPFLSDFLSYDIAKLFFLSGIQLFITVYAFARWYLESYSAHAGFLTHQWGVFFKKNRTVPLNESMTITVSSGPLGKLFHYGSIRIENNPLIPSIILSDISRPTRFLETLDEHINPQNRYFAPPDLTQLLTTDEHEGLEFKSSLRFDHRSGNVNRELERATMKTVAAFLNTKGGSLVIGVNDLREPIGLLHDYRSMQRPSSDGFENHFTQVFNAMIGPEFRHLVKLWFREHTNAEICVVQVAPSTRPVYLKVDGNEHFFVRTGNITTTLKLSEIESYRRSRWSHRVSPDT